MQPQTEHANRTGALDIIAAALLAYGALGVLLQFDASQKLLGGLRSYGSIGSAITPATLAPRDLDSALQSAYSALTLGQPLAPWLAWAVGATLLLVTRRARRATEDVVPRPAVRSLHWWLGVTPLAVAVALGLWLRGTNLLPMAGGVWTGSNYDEMVYYSQAELFLRGALPYRDAFMAHPPGVVWAFAPALLFERVWGGAAAFVAARQWLLIYSATAIPLVWLAASRLGGWASGAVAALLLAFDGKAAFAPQSERRLPNVGVLETVANAGSLGAMVLYVYCPAEGRWRWAWLGAAGALGGLAALGKAPGVAALAALVLFTLLERRWRDAFTLIAGAAVAVLAGTLPFLLAAPGQMIRQAIFFQLLRPQEVREGIDQASRIAAYPESQVTLLLAGLGLVAAAVLVWRGRREPLSRPWALPVFWAAPIVAVFVLGRSFHSQYYTQVAAPLSLLASAVAAETLWRGRRALAWGAAAVGALLVLPLSLDQWRVSSSPAPDEVYRETGRVVARALPAGAHVMAYDPGYAFAAGIPPARLQLDGGREGPYLIDTAGYTIFTAQEMDRAPWLDLLGRAFGGPRLRNEEEVLALPESQGALMSGLSGATQVVLDQKIALPKISGQGVLLIEALSHARSDIGFASVFDMPAVAETAAVPFPIALFASSISRLDDHLVPVVGNDTLQIERADAVQIGLYWHVLSPHASDLRVVVRLLDAAGNTALQVDTEPSEGSEHTSTWRAGFVYPDLRNIALSSVAPGEYRLAVRLYDPTGGQSSAEIAMPQRVLVK